MVTVFGQNGKYELGARSTGMGGASLMLNDQWSIFNSIGAFARSEGNVAFTSLRNQFDLPEFQVLGAGYSHRLEKVTVGFGFYRFGDRLFSEQRINLAIGHMLDRVSLGINIDYLQYNISTVGTKGTLLFEFGGVAEITDQIQFGAQIFNVNQAKILSKEGERVPTTMKAGISFRPSAELMFNLETEKELGFDEVFRLGLEYQIAKKTYIRTGFSTAPFKGAFGVGFYPRHFQFDYSFSSHTNLGSIHEISVSYLLQSK